MIIVIITSFISILPQNAFDAKKSQKNICGGYECAAA